MPWKPVARKCKQKSTGKTGTHAVVKIKSSGGTEQESCHTSKEKADAAIRARYANETDTNEEEVLREYVKSILIESAIGQCYPHAVKLAQQTTDEEFSDLSKFKVIHGRITDKWSGESVEHAWVEKRGMIFDWQTHQTKPDGIPRDVYYDQFQPEAYEEYTAEEAIVNCMKNRQMGPWR